MRLESGRPNITTDYLTENLLTSTHPAVSWLRECINKAVRGYIGHLSIDYQLDWQLQGWPSINRFGDYHNLHNHPHAWLPGTYSIKVPNAKVTLPGRQDRNPSEISFYDPRPQANMNAIQGDGQVDPEFRVQPEPGQLIIWPAFLHHMVHPNLAEDVRISISFNVVLRQSESHLPPQ